MRTFTAAAIVLLLWSCKKDTSNSATPPAPPSLHSDVSSITLAATTGSNDSFNISSNINWSVSINPSTATWLNISAATGSNNGKVYVSAASDNLSSANRTATVVVSPVGTTAVQAVSINVTQGFTSGTSSPFLLWQKALGGSGRDFGSAVIATPDGNYLMAGYTSSNDGNVSGNKGDRDVWLVKFTNSGDVIWQKTFGGTAFDWAWSLVNTFDGGFAFVGQTLSNDGDVSGNHGSGDVWVVKLTSGGSIVWQKCLGGSNDDIGYSIAEAADRSLVIVGRTLSSDGDAVGFRGTADVFAARLSSTGDVIWKRVIGGSAQDVGWAVCGTADNGCIITGNTASLNGDITGVHGFLDVLAVKLDSSGNIVWQKAFGGSDGEEGRSIISTADGGCIIAGSTESNDGDVTSNHGGGDAWILKLNSSGSLEWEKTFGGTGDEGFNSINVDLSGKLIAAGGATSTNGDVPSNNGDVDFWAIAMDTNGNISGSKAFGGMSHDEATGIVNTSDGNYIMTGFTASGDGDVSGFHGGTYDAWIAKFKFQ